MTKNPESSKSRPDETRMVDGRIFRVISLPKAGRKEMTDGPDGNRPTTGEILAATKLRNERVALRLGYDARRLTNNIYNGSPPGIGYHGNGLLPSWSLDKMPKEDDESHNPD